MVVNEIQAASYQCQKRPHEEKALPSYFPFSFLTLSSSLDPEEIAATLWPWGDKHNVKRPPTKEVKAERKSEPWCLTALLSDCAGPRGLPTSKLLVMMQIYPLFVHAISRGFSIICNTCLTNTLSQVLRETFISSSYFLLCAKCLSCRGPD